MESAEALPLVPLRDVVLFPRMHMPFLAGREATLRALEHAFINGDNRVFVATQRDAATENPRPADVYGTGCVARVVAQIKQPDGTVKALVEGMERATAVGWNENQDFIVAFVSIVPPVLAQLTERRRDSALSLLDSYLRLADDLRYGGKIKEIRDADLGALADRIAAHLKVGAGEKQYLLETHQPVKRLAIVEDILTRELERLRISPEEAAERRKQRALEELALRRVLRRILEGPSLAKPLQSIERLPLDKIVARGTRQLWSQSGGLTDAGRDRLGELLDLHEAVLSIAESALAEAIVILINDDEEDPVAQKLRGAFARAGLLRRGAAATRLAFGVPTHRPDSA